MPSLNLLVVLAVALGFVLIGILLFPNVREGKKRKKKTVRMPEVENKDWKLVSLRLEKHIYALRKEIAVMGKREKVLAKELAVEREKYLKVQHKIAQERGWKRKETSDIDKKNKEIIRLKKDLGNTEKGLTQEHGQRLRLEREAKELNESIEKSNETLRSLEAQIANMQAQGEAQRKEISEVKMMNQQLSRKHDDATWIAKSEHVKMEKALKEDIRERDREIHKLKTILRKEGFLE